MKYTIHQGDAFKLPLTIRRNGVIQTTSNISKIEVVLAGIRKEYPGEITYDSSGQRFLFPLSQAETLALNPCVYNLQIRPLFSVDDSVLGWISACNIEVVAMNGAEEL